MSALKVLLIAPTYVDTPNTMYFPIGMAYLTSYIRSKGHHVDGFNMNNTGLEKGKEHLINLLSSYTYDVIGIGALTIAFEQIQTLVEFLRPLSKAKIVLGGGITSCESEIIIQNIKPDYMVISEGEVIFEHLLQHIASKGMHPLPKGTWVRQGESIVVQSNDGESIQELDELPFPDYDMMGIEGFIELQSGQVWSYHKSDPFIGKYIPVSASRSCPFKCTFCYHAGMGSFRMHSVEYAIAFIKELKTKYGITHFSIYDELFAVNVSRVLDFCKAAKSLNITFVCQLRVDQITQEMLYEMKDAGCVEISFGFESASDTVIKSMQKKITAQQIEDAIIMTRKAKIGIQGNFLFGDPAETEETLQTTLEFQEKNRLFFVDWSMVIPYPGTVLHTQALHKNMISDRVQYIKDVANTSKYLWNSPINLTNYSNESFLQTYAELRELNDINHRKAASTILESQAIDENTSYVRVECPHCQEETEYEQFPYPLNSNQSATQDRGSFFGLTGVNLVCPQCREKHHLLSKKIPHVASAFESFNQKLDELLQKEGDNIVVLPAMDRYFHACSEDTNVLKIKPHAVLDTRDYRVGDTFLDTPVEKFSAEKVQSLNTKQFVILPWVESNDVMHVLKENGVSEQQVLRWNS